MEDSIEIKEINPQTRAIELEKSKDSIPMDKMDEYLNLIRTIVASIFSGGNIPPGIEFDDLVGYGYEGLMKAWKNYKNDKGALFKTYATYRIRGEVLDYIRKEWKSRNPSYQRKVDKEKVQEKIQEGDIILIKGSRSMKMEKIVKEIMAEPEKAKELLVQS